MSAPVPPKLAVTGLVKQFRVGRGVAVTAIDGIDLHVDPGELVCIVGASGCGKSTLLNIVGGLETRTSGAVEVDGEPVIGPGPDRGMVFQSASLYPWKTVAENVAFGLECARTPKDSRPARVAELLAIVGLTEFADRLPKELSGGMRQRVAIARALAPEPDVLLLDEPFGALDALTRAHLQDEVMRIQADLGNTMMMITHDVDEAVLLSDRIVMMTNGPSATIGEILNVDLPRPRDRIALADDHEYNRCRRAVLSFLHDRHRLQ